MTSRREQTSVAIPVLLTVIVHGALAGGLEAAHHYAEQAKDDSVMTVQFDVPPKTAPKAPPAAPPPEVVAPPKVAALRLRSPARVSAPEPLPSQPPASEPPAPGAPDPADEVPAPEYTYRLDAPLAGGGTMAVAGGGRPTGSLYGRKDGSGTGKGGAGGPADSQGTGRMASAASIATLPVPLEDYSDDNWEDYPEEALRLGIEGPRVRAQRSRCGAFAQDALPARNPEGRHPGRLLRHVDLALRAPQIAPR